ARNPEGKVPCTDIDAIDVPRIISLKRNILFEIALETVKISGTPPHAKRVIADTNPREGRNARHNHRASGRRWWVPHRARARARDSARYAPRVPPHRCAPERGRERAR